MIVRGFAGTGLITRGISIIAAAGRAAYQYVIEKVIKPIRKVHSGYIGLRLNCIVDYEFAPYAVSPTNEADLLLLMDEDLWLIGED